MCARGHTHTYTQCRYLTVFQIIQFCSGGTFTVIFYGLYFKNIRVAETLGSWSLTFDKGCQGDVFSVVMFDLTVG